jgi:hypothetical protein
MHSGAVLCICMDRADHQTGAGRMVLDTDLHLRGQLSQSATKVSCKTFQSRYHFSHQCSLWYYWVWQVYHGWYVFSTFMVLTADVHQVCILPRGNVRRKKSSDTRTKNHFWSLLGHHIITFGLMHFSMTTVCLLFVSLLFHCVKAN